MINIIERLFQRNKDNEKGATAVELALIILIFIFIVFGIIEFGLLTYNQHIVTNASREGARAGVVFRSSQESHDVVEIVETFGKNNIFSFGDSDFKVEVYNLDDQEYQDKIDDSFKICEKSNDELAIRVTYNYVFLFLPFNKKLSSITRMRCE